MTEWQGSIIISSIFFARTIESKTTLWLFAIVWFIAALVGRVLA